jgi:hypothetical protein
LKEGEKFEDLNVDDMILLERFLETGLAVSR